MALVECFGCKHLRQGRVCDLTGAPVSTRCDRFEESGRLKALRDLTHLSEEMGGYDPEMAAENPLIKLG